MKIRCRNCGKEIYVKIDNVNIIPYHSDPYILRIYTTSYCKDCNNITTELYRIPLDRAKLLELIKEL